MNFKQDLKFLAYSQAFIGTLMLVPMMLSIYFGESQATKAFATAFCFIAAFVIIVLAACIFIRDRFSFGTRDGFFCVTLCWVLGTAFAAIPLYSVKAFPDFASCYFELMSGFTTTGATALTIIEPLDKSILFWRSMANWLGGMGIVVLFVALQPSLTGTSGTKLFGAESVGPTKDKLTPKIKSTAAILWLIYFFASLLQTICLMIAGLDAYDAVTVTFSTISAAGFCVRNASIGAFASPAVDVIVTIFMMVGGTNFALFFFLLKGKFRIVFKDGELRAYIGILFSVILIVAAALLINGTYPDFWTALRYSAFQCTSIMTTTGFATADYQVWPAACQMLLFLLFFVGGCAGSAGGGIKVIRIATLFKAANAQIKSRIHPNGVFSVRIGDTVVKADIVSSISSFFFAYIITGLLGSAALSFSGADLSTSISSSFLCLGNIGIGFGQVGPTGNFGFYPGWAKWVCSFLMLVGRLELFTVYSIFSKGFFSI
ncbi:MAG: potassium transporter TrkG [Sphaerochaetaceae bacterium]|nr:potassium transporter TrkG [Sphaerochaetaceae bacterium]